MRSRCQRRSLDDSSPHPARRADECVASRGTSSSRQRVETTSGSAAYTKSGAKRKTNSAKPLRTRWDLFDVNGRRRLRLGSGKHRVYASKFSETRKSG